MVRWQVFSHATCAKCSPECYLAFKQNCSTRYAADGDVALTASDYDLAILLYSGAIELDPTSETVFANCSKAKLKKALWEEALVDAQKVRWYLFFWSQHLFRRTYVGHRTQSIVLYWIPVEVRSVPWRTAL